MIWTLQVRQLGFRWKSIIQCAEHARLKRHMDMLEYPEKRIVELPLNPVRIVEDRRGRLREVGITFWK